LECSEPGETHPALLRHHQELAVAGVNTSNWEHADWQEESSAAARLTALAQHITEVRQAVVEWTGTEGRSNRINVTYLKSLEDQLKELRSAVNMGAAFSRNSNIATVVTPQF
jgi:hypothetical protein